MGLFKKKLGDAAVPGETTLTFPAGRVRISYDEERKGRSVDSESSGKPWPGIPGGLEVSIRPAAGGDLLEINTGWSTSEYSTLKRIGTRYGKLEIPTDGEYVVSVAPIATTRELFDPLLKFTT
jgi:hypothetical protein